MSFSIKTKDYILKLKCLKRGRHTKQKMASSHHRLSLMEFLMVILLPILELTTAIDLLRSEAEKSLNMVNLWIQLIAIPAHI